MLHAAQHTNVIIYNSLHNIFLLDDFGISLINCTPPFNCLCSATFPFSKSTTSCSPSSLLLSTNAREAHQTSHHQRLVLIDGVQEGSTHTMKYRSQWLIWHLV